MVVWFIASSVAAQVRGKTVEEESKRGMKKGREKSQCNTCHPSMLCRPHRHPQLSGGIHRWPFPLSNPTLLLRPQQGHRNVWSERTLLTTLFLPFSYVLFSLFLFLPNLCFLSLPLFLFSSCCLGLKWTSPSFLCGSRRYSSWS